MIKTSVIFKFIELCKQKLPLCKTYNDIIYNLEMNLADIFEQKDCYIKLDCIIHGVNICYERDDLYEKMLNSNIFPIVKIKKIINDPTRTNIHFFPKFIQDKFKLLEIDINALI